METYYMCAFCGIGVLEGEDCSCITGAAARFVDDGESVTCIDVHPPSSNPKTLTGALKVPNLSVIPFTALIREAEAMRYGAFEAPRVDGTKGYGPFNWRDQPIEYMVYVEAAIRHLACAADREDLDPTSKATHLGHARATIGILIDAIENETVIDDRPKNAKGTVARLLRELTKTP